MFQNKSLSKDDYNFFTIDIFLCRNSQIIFINCPKSEFCDQIDHVLSPKNINCWSHILDDSFRKKNPDGLVSGLHSGPVKNHRDSWPPGTRKSM
jgi:hypothetical protein